jgi:integrase
VFVTRDGTWHHPTNIQGRLRHIRLLDDYADLTVLQGVTPHSFRRTVATEIDEVYDAEAAKNQLGHTSKTVTERHYIKPPTGGAGLPGSHRAPCSRFRSRPRHWTRQVGPVTADADLLPLREAL